jgi:hypothetical protein
MEGQTKAKQCADFLSYYNVAFLEKLSELMEAKLPDGIFSNQNSNLVKFWRA